ncbi:iron-containing alcohol dehydrogenase [bacterium]|nr:iron-containing alcohol dehydrogenase [bacterium]
MNGFDFFLPTRLIFGPGRLSEVGEQTKRFGKTAAIVIDRFLAETGLYKRIEQCLLEHGVRSFAFTGVEPNPLCSIVNQTAELFKDKNIDFVIGVGGGSSIDFAKALAVALTHDGDIWHYVNEPGRPVGEITSKTLPVVAVPTTSGTGAEMTAVSVLVNPETHVKRGLYSEKIYPVMAIIDPELMLTIPRNLTATTGIDALSHAIEAYISTDANPFSDMVAIEAMRQISDSLPAAINSGQKIEARSSMAWGSALAGIAISSSCVTLVHALAHPLGGRFNIGHGEAIAMGLIPVMRRTWMLDIPKFGKIAEALGVCTHNMSPKSAAKSSINALTELIEETGLSLRLGNFGVRQTDLDKLAEDATGYMAGCLESHPHVCSVEEVKNIFLEMF